MPGFPGVFSLLIILAFRVFLLRRAALFERTTPRHGRRIACSFPVYRVMRVTLRKGEMATAFALYIHDGEIVLFVLHGCGANFNQEVH